MRKILSLLFMAVVVLAVTGCAFVSAVGDGNVTRVDLFNMSYRTGLPAEKPLPLLDQVHQVTTRPALKRLTLPENPMWLTDLIPKKEPATKPTEP